MSLPGCQGGGGPARPDPAALADQVFAAIQDNGYGQYDDLISQAAPALLRNALSRLEAVAHRLAGASADSTSAASAKAKRRKEATIPEGSPSILSAQLAERRDEAVEVEGLALLGAAFGHQAISAGRS